MSDAYWSNVVLNMRMEGANNGTSFIDDKGHSFEVQGGQVITSTAQVKYGTSSAYFNGGYLRTSIDNELDFAAGEDFTLEAWVYITTVDAFYWPIFEARYTPSYTPYAFGIRLVSGTKRLDFFDGVDGRYSTSIVPMNTWTHVAAVRMSGILSLYINGVLDVTTYTIPGALAPSGTFLYLGAITDGLRAYGYIDDLRITKGVARYSASFVPPTEIWNGTEISFNFNLPSASVTATSYPPSVAILQSFNLPSVDLSLAPLLPSYTTVIPSDQIFHLPAASLTITPFDPVTYFKVNLITADLELSPDIPQLTDLPVRWKINREAKQGITFQAAQSNFGEAYQQAAPKGLRSKEVTWQIQWIGLTDAEKDTVVKGLEGFGFHINLYWEAPYQLEEEAFLVRDPFTVTKDAIASWKVEATLLRRYNALPKLAFPGVAVGEEPIVPSGCPAWIPPTVVIAPSGYEIQVLNGFIFITSMPGDGFWHTEYMALSKYSMDFELLNVTNLPAGSIHAYGDKLLYRGTNTNLYFIDADTLGLTTILPYAGTFNNATIIANYIYTVRHSTLLKLDYLGNILADEPAIPLAEATWNFGMLTTDAAHVYLLSTTSVFPFELAKYSQLDLAVAATVSLPAGNQPSRMAVSSQYVWVTAFPNKLYKYSKGLELLHTFEVEGFQSGSSPTDRAYISFVNSQLVLSLAEANKVVFINEAATSSGNLISYEIPFTGGKKPMMTSVSQDVGTEIFTSSL